MRKTVLILMVSLLMMTSCGTYTAEGAATGGYFGAMIGSMIGGVTDGWRGHDVGGLIGMAGGAIVGAAIGNAADQAEARKYEQYQREREERRAARRNQDVLAERDGNYDPAVTDDGYFDPTNSGDDRITFDGATTPGVYPPETTAPNANEGLIIRNAYFRDADGNGVLVAGEECRVSFEIMNNTGRVVYDVQPIVYDLTGNKHIHISQNLHVESIMPGKGIRYTATIKGDSRLKDGTAKICVGVARGNREVEGQTKEFIVPTRKRNR